ncbi:MAG: 50S ribosomal protein L9 [Verrucomicrobia bacterium]|jgi:large subunit ribosomal protein L9|nr:50S ribosomal protein L9 [Verrucomicrobiota bacterium]
MPKTHVILTSNIIGLGAESDQVSVAAGYARNYLIPEGLAIPLTAANKRRLEVLRQRRAEREAHELNTMTELARSLEKLVLVIKVKTGDDGKMFGSITSGAIADELKHQFDIRLDKRKIQLAEPIKSVGEHEVAMNLHQDVKGTLKLRVESTTPPPLPEEASPETRTEGKTDRRGRRPRVEEAPGAKHAAEKTAARASAEKPSGKGGSRKAE